MKASDFIVEGYREAGRVIVKSALTPISLQARRDRLSDLKVALKEAITTSTDFLMTHDVEVTLTWYVTEADRYQSHTAADVDNVIKPLLDAATGPEGIMIDDNQVQSIRAYWVTPGTPGPGFELDFQALDREDVVTRDGTAFVEFASDTCYILPGIQPEAWPVLVASYRKSLEAKEDLRRLGAPERMVHSLSPLARPWPSQRLRMQKFPVFQPTDDFGPVPERFKDLL